MRSRLAARRRGLQRPTLSSWTCFRAPPKSLRWIGSSARTPSLKGGSCHFSVICIVRSPVPGSSHFPLALLTRQPLTSERLTAGAAATTLRVYVAAIAARRELDEIPLGRHRLVSAFVRGARRLRPVRPTAVPSWDLSVVLEGLVTAPFEPLESASDRILTLKVVLLLALTSLKRVGDLQAFSVSETCMDFAPGLVKVTLRPRPGYIPKVLSTSFRSQLVTLHSFHPPPFASSEDERLHMLCPVRALKLYVDRSKVWRKSPQLLICFGAGRRGLATSKQRISHWVRDAISLAYEARELPSPLSLRAHSTRGVASSQALFRGVPLEDICVVAGWSSPHTFVRFYNLDVDTAPGSQVLSV